MGVISNALGKKNSPPPAPNFQAAAQQQGQDNMATARLQTELNRPSEMGPAGSRTWTQNGDQWSSNTSLSPELQGMLDKSTTAANNTLGGDFGAGRDAIVDALYRRSTRLMDPQYAQSEDQMRSDLVNRGFSVGDKGYTTATDNFQRMKDEDYANARDRAMTGGVQQAIMERQEPINEVSNILAMNKFQPYAATSNISPAPTFAGTQAQWGAQMDQANYQQAGQAGLMNGLFGLGASYLGSGGRFGFG